MKDALTFQLSQGVSSLLISVPHSGLAVPGEILCRFSPAASTLPDTDWFVDRLYNWAAGLGAGLLTAPMSRYVVDLNRPPDDKPLYDQGSSALLTGLVPLKTFSGEEIYVGSRPDETETSNRLETFWAPYHSCLAAELERIRGVHGYAVLLDAHSIQSRQPLLFDGTLPDLNLGSNSGKSADSSLINAAREVLAQSDYSFVVDGRFKGGYITRHYGQPTDHIHALQLEMAQTAYMREELREWSEERSGKMAIVLQQLVKALISWKP